MLEAVCTKIEKIDLDPPGEDFELLVGGRESPEEAFGWGNGSVDIRKAMLCMLQQTI